MTEKHKEQSIAEIIDNAAKEAGVDPRDPYFRAQLTKALIAAGYFRADALLAQREKEQ